MSAELAPPVRIDEYFELRLYRMWPGRMPGFHALMRDEVPPLFARAGIPRPLAFWRSHAGPMAPLFAYLIPWRNLDDRMAAWRRFYADPDWQAALAANYAGRQRVERSDVLILRPSPVWARFKGRGGGPFGGVHELRVQDVLNQDPAAAHEALAATDLPFLSGRGAAVLGVFGTWFGTSMNQVMTILAWPDAATMLSAHAAHGTDPEIAAARDEERRRHGRPLVRGCEIHVLEPLAYGIPNADLTPSEA